MSSVKLSVTVRRNLAKKYQEAELKKIDLAIKQWVAADSARGFQTIHVAIDDVTGMKALGVRAVSGKITANKLKQAIDVLWHKLSPDYLVLFGGDDIVPYFIVTNPSYDSSSNGDDDTTVSTDNPYACSGAFRASKRATYLVPDRVVGRIPDVPSATDPLDLLKYLGSISKWESKPRSAYAKAYAICCDEWKGAGVRSLEHIGEPAARLMISPPTGDRDKLPKSRLKSLLHMIKCHGSQIDPKFYGQKGTDFPVSLSSQTLLKTARHGTVVGAMCCYGAQMFSPADPLVDPAGASAIPHAYLRKGAYGFLGATRIAWVGDTDMACADWIVASFLKGVMGGASLGRALLESKQDYYRWINQQGAVPGVEDDKTLIEFVLLGDPSIHPVSPAKPTPSVRSARRARPAGVQPNLLLDQERRQRRAFRSDMAGQIRSLLPTRVAARRAAKERAGKIRSALSDLFGNTEGHFDFANSEVQVNKLETNWTTGAVVAAGRGSRGVAQAKVTGKRESYEYYWAAKRRVNSHQQIRLVRVETDTKGNVIRYRMVMSS